MGTNKKEFCLLISYERSHKLCKVHGICPSDWKFPSPIQQNCLTIHFNEPYHIRSSGIQIFYPGIFDDFGLYICFNTGIDEHTTLHCYKLLI